MPTTIKSVDGGTIKVEQFDGRRSGVGTVVDGGERKGVQHSTETTHIDLDWSRGYAHLAVGPSRTADGKVAVHQHTDFGRTATTLRNESGGVETNSTAVVQIEMAGYSSRDPWLPSKEQASVMASVYEWIGQELGVPQVYPYDIAALKTGVWATPSNPWRQARTFVDRAGWHGHIAVLENDHWDPGALMMDALLSRRYPPEMVTAHQIVVRYRNDNRWRTEPLSAHFAKKADLRAWSDKHQAMQWRVLNNQVRLDGEWVQVQDTRLDLATRRVKASLAK